MDNPEFVYVTYIRTGPQPLWRALTDPDFTPWYWFGSRVESDWQVGSEVRVVGPNGKVWDYGEVVECESHRAHFRLSFTWTTVMPELVGEPASRVTFELEPAGAEMKLTLTHDGFQPGSRVYESVRMGWPALLSCLKSILETGEPLAIVERMLESGESLPPPRKASG